LAGPAEALFGENYFKLMKSALRPGGIVCSQGETVWTCLDLVHNMVQHCNTHFPSTSYAFTSVPTYPTGQIGFVLGSLDSVRNYQFNYFLSMGNVHLTMFLIELSAFRFNK